LPATAKPAPGLRGAKVVLPAYRACSG